MGEIYHRAKAHIPSGRSIIRGGSMMRRARFSILLLGVVSLGCHREKLRKPVNVVLVSIDSLRADHVRSYGYARETTPTLDRIAAEGALFESVVAESTWTLPSHVTMLTGVGSLVHRVDQFAGARLDDAFATLAERFQAAGYATEGIYSGPYLHPLFGFGRGFERYEGVLGDVSLDGEIDLEEPDAGRKIMRANSRAHRTVTSPEISKRAVDFLDRRDDRPFFLFLHYFDVHYDYVPPEELWRRFDPDYQGSLRGENYRRNDAIHRGMDPRELSHVVARYDGEVLFTDRHIGAVIDALERKGLKDDTLVVITSDHGEEFFEHGNKGHGQTLMDETLLVPLIVRLPGRIPSGLRLREQVRHLDIAPTVLSLAGLKSELPGQDLEPALTGGGRVPPLGAVSVLRRSGDWLSFREPGFKYVVHRAPSGETELLYDLTRDPGEKEPRGADASGSGPSVESILRLRSELDREERFADALRGGKISPDAGVELPEDVLERLRALGYTAEQ
jgi:arylsulfatase A-like enzyme